MGLLGGTRTLLIKELPAIVSLVMPFFQDVHERVRYAAAHCIGQLAEDFGQVDKGKNFQAKFHSAVVPGLIHMLGPQEVGLA
jgi:hypothetical protein